MTNPLMMKLEHHTRFAPEDQSRLHGLIMENRRRFAPQQDILSEGKHIEHVVVVLSGTAVRQKILRNGRRQITAFLIPGDLCDAEVFVLAHMDHSVTAVRETTCALIPASTMKELLTEVRGLTSALWWSTMTDAAVLRQRIIDLGQRDARERVAHLFYEMLIRYRMIGRAVDNSYPFPLSQSDLADATGLSLVHV